MLSDKEINDLFRHLENNVSARNSYKTFAFTTVLATLGVAFVAEAYVEPWFFLVPYCLIVPIAARIVYYRITHARLSSFLMVYAPGDMLFAIKGPNVPENDGRTSFSALEWLNNYELFLLSLVCLFAFYSKYPKGISNFTIIDYLICELPLALSGIVFLLTQYGIDYSQWRNKYKSKWRALKQKEEQKKKCAVKFKNKVAPPSKIRISDEEYNKIIEKLKFFDTTRNTLLTFSFTAVLAVLGIAISTDVSEMNPWICLIPFFLIIPFSARISYYRLVSARANAFLKKFVPEKMVFELGSSAVPEKHGSAYPIIAWMINHEMVLLGLATGVIFIIKLIEFAPEFGPLEYLQAHIPVFLIVIVFLISNSTYSYKKLSENYNEKWDEYYKELQEQMIISKSLIRHRKR